MSKISKQVIVVRKDLNMRKGKMVAQGAHASLKAILDNMQNQNCATAPDDSTPINYKVLWLKDSSPLKDWIENKFTKICVGVDSEEELFDIVNKAQSAGLPCALITDAGLTEFDGKPTRTCCAIGPAWSDKVDKITGHLKLL
jgi:PTH2 family peptidyl-tRNA hydrolase